MTEKIKARRLPEIKKPSPKTSIIGVFAPCDPMIDELSRRRAKNIVE